MCDHDGKVGNFHYANPTWPPRLVDDVVCPKSALRIAVPSGIGAALWSLTKVPAMRKKYGAEKVHIAVQNSEIQRAAAFVEAFDFVDSVSFEDFPIHPEDPFTKQGKYAYVPSQSDYFGYDWLLIANEHLEMGRRLEEWLPEYETDFSIGKRFCFNVRQLDYADAVHDQHGPYVVFYLGPEGGNTAAGHNRGGLWREDDWLELGQLCRRAQLSVVVVGAEYDRGYSAPLVDRARREKCEWVDLVGRTEIRETFAVIRRAKFVVSYQSGIGIFCPYLGVPAAVFWRPYGDSIHPSHFVSFQEAMASAWVPPDVLETRRFLPLIYGRCTPQSIVEHAVDHRWIK